MAAGCQRRTISKADVVIELQNQLKRWIVPGLRNVVRYYLPITTQHWPTCRLTDTTNWHAVEPSIDYRCSYEFALHSLVWSVLVRGMHRVSRNNPQPTRRKR